jgi:hypothetical protein
VLDGAEDGPLQGGLVALDEQEVVRSAVPVLLAAGDVVRGLALGVGRVGGDYGVVQVHAGQQLFDLGGLGGLVRDPDLPDDHLFLLQHRGEQLDLAVGDAAQPFPVDRDRGQQPVQAAGIRQGAQPAADDLVEDVRADGVDQGADPRLARGDDPPQQRMRPPAQPAQDILRQVSGLVPDLPEALRPGQRARDRNGEHEDQQIAASPALARVRDPRKYFQQAGNLPCCVSIGAGHSGSAGMRN